MVPQLSIIFMIISAAVGIILPIAVCLYLRIRKRADLPPFVIGCVVFFLFALILESMVHQLVLVRSPAGETIQNTAWLYALYGGLMAGLFEETGRYLAFKTVMKRYGGKDVNALMYGIGHGGIEAILLLGFAMISNITVSLMINSGTASQLTENLSGDALTQMQSSLELLKTTPSYMFLLGGVERLSALTIHMALSVFVWFSVFRENKLGLYIIAILLHALVDGLTVIFQSTGMNTVLLEACVMAMAICIALYALKLWKDNHIEHVTEADSVTETDE